MLENTLTSLVDAVVNERYSAGHQETRQQRKATAWEAVKL